VASHIEEYIVLDSLPGTATKLVITQGFLISEDHRSFAWLVLGKFLDAGGNLLWGTEILLVRYDPSSYPDLDRDESESESSSEAVSHEDETDLAIYESDTLVSGGKQFMLLGQSVPCLPRSHDTFMMLFSFSSTEVASLRVLHHVFRTSPRCKHHVNDCGPVTVSNIAPIKIPQCVG